MSNKFKRNFITACIISALIAAGIVLLVRYSVKPRSCSLKPQQAQEETTIQEKTSADLSKNPLTEAIKAYRPEDSTKQIEELAKNEELINAGDGTDGKEGIPLVAAVLKRDLRLVEILLDHGAKVGILDGWSDTPLMLATKNNDLLIMMALIDAGADVDAHSDCMFPSHGDSALGYAIEIGSINALKLLLAHKASPNYVIAKGALGVRNITPLTFAITRDKSPELIQILIDKGADVNYMEGYHQDFTPLMAAAFSSNTEAIQILIKAGANPKTKNGKGETAADWAKYRYNEVITSLGLETPKLPPQK